MYLYLREAAMRQPPRPIANNKTSWSIPQKGCRWPSVNPGPVCAWAAVAIVAAVSNVREKIPNLVFIYICSAQRFIRDRLFFECQYLSILVYDHTSQLARPIQLKSSSTTCIARETAMPKMGKPGISLHYGGCVPGLYTKKIM